jgi:hypothetical protein
MEPFVAPGVTTRRVDWKYCGARLSKLRPQLFALNFSGSGFGSTVEPTNMVAFTYADSALAEPRDWRPLFACEDSTAGCLRHADSRAPLGKRSDTIKIKIAIVAGVAGSHDGLAVVASRQ